MRKRKERIDRPTEAFRRWARAGCPSAEEIQSRGGPWARDMLACVAVFDVLGNNPHRRANGTDADVMRAVRGVYMIDAGRPLRRREITGRVRSVAAQCFVSERTVFAWLAKARRMWEGFASNTEDFPQT